MSISDYMLLQGMIAFSQQPVWTSRRIEQITADFTTRCSNCFCMKYKLWKTQFLLSSLSHCHLPSLICALKETLPVLLVPHQPPCFCEWLFDFIVKTANHFISVALMTCFIFFVLVCVLRLHERCDRSVPLRLPGRSLTPICLHGAGSQ